MPHETVIYDRKQLHAEVWEEAVDIVAKRYNVSGVALAKMCRKLRVPLPRRGYWARKRAGQKLKRPPLRPVKKGEPEQIRVSRWHEPEGSKPTILPETEAIIAQEAAPEAAIVVPATLDSAHKLVAMSAKLLQKAKPVDGVVRCRDRRCLDVVVSPVALDRALRIVDALLNALTERDLKVEVTDVRSDEPHRSGYYVDRRDDDVPSNVTRVRVAGEWIGFRITEKVSHKRPPPPPAPKHMRGPQADVWQRISRAPVEHVPTGELSLSILDASYHSARSSWRDGKRQRVEECLNAFVSSLYLTSDAIKANRIEWERRRKEAEEEERRRWEERRRLEEEAQRTKELEEMIRQWRLAQDVRAYVAEARKMVADANLTITASGPLDKWLRFAASHAEKVDPLSGLRADIMKVLADKPTTDASSGTPDAASSNQTESG